MSEDYIFLAILSKVSRCLYCTTLIVMGYKYIITFILHLIIDILNILIVILHFMPQMYRSVVKPHRPIHFVCFQHAMSL